MRDRLGFRVEDEAGYEEWRRRVDDVEWERLMKFLGDGFGLGDSQAYASLCWMSSQKGVLQRRNVDDALHAHGDVDRALQTLTASCSPLVSHLKKSELIVPIERVSKAFTLRNQDTGYVKGCVSFATLSAAALSEKQAFWMLVGILEQQLQSTIHAEKTFADVLSIKEVLRAACDAKRARATLVFANATGKKTWRDGRQSPSGAGGVSSSAEAAAAAVPTSTSAPDLFAHLTKTPGLFELVVTPLYRAVFSETQAPPECILYIWRFVLSTGCNKDVPADCETVLIWFIVCMLVYFEEELLEEDDTDSDADASFHTTAPEGVDSHSWAFGVRFSTTTHMHADSDGDGGDDDDDDVNHSGGSSGGTLSNAAASGDAAASAAASPPMTPASPTSPAAHLGLPRVSTTSTVGGAAAADAPCFSNSSPPASPKMRQLSDPLQSLTHIPHKSALRKSSSQDRKAGAAAAGAAAAAAESESPDPESPAKTPRRRMASAVFQPVQRSVSRRLEHLLRHELHRSENLENICAMVVQMCAQSTLGPESDAAEDSDEGSGGGGGGDDDDANSVAMDLDKPVSFEEFTSRDIRAQEVFPLKDMAELRRSNLFAVEKVRGVTKQAGGKCWVHVCSELTATAFFKYLVPLFAHHAREHLKQSPNVEPIVSCSDFLLFMEKIKVDPLEADLAALHKAVGGKHIDLLLALILFRMDGGVQEKIEAIIRIFVKHENVLIDESSFWRLSRSPAWRASCTGNATPLGVAPPPAVRGDGGAEYEMLRGHLFREKAVRGESGGCFISSSHLRDILMSDMYVTFLLGPPPTSSPARQWTATNNVPDWVQDEAAPCCFLCSRYFKWYRRRHHCRACGQVICDACSVRRSLRAAGFNNPVRVCIACADS